jgi:hypothetical protein
LKAYALCAGMASPKTAFHTGSRWKASAHITVTPQSSVGCQGAPSSG